LPSLARVLQIPDQLAAGLKKDVVVIEATGSLEAVSKLKLAL
jgi:hypothetical protein